MGKKPEKKNIILSLVENKSKELLQELIFKLSEEFPEVYRYVLETFEQTKDSDLERQRN